MVRLCGKTTEWALQNVSGRAWTSLHAGCGREQKTKRAMALLVVKEKHTRLIGWRGSLSVGLCPLALAFSTDATIHRAAIRITCLSGLDRTITETCLKRAGIAWVRQRRPPMNVCTSVVKSTTDLFSLCLSWSAYERIEVWGCLGASWQQGTALAFPAHAALRSGSRGDMWERRFRPWASTT